MSIKWIDYNAKILDAPSEKELIKKVETAYRICYNSVDKMQNESFEDSVKFITANIKRGHHSPLEHANITIEATIDRGLLAEITRHRIGSFSVSSTRYIKYNAEVPCIMPYEIRAASQEIRDEFKSSIEQSIQTYQDLLKLDVKPENARALLPQALAVNLIETHNMREWMHIFDLRYAATTGKPHPDMRIWMHKIYLELQKLYPHIINTPIEEVANFEKQYKNVN